MRYPDYILKVLGAVALIMAASSCVKSDILYDESQGEISISPVSSVQSKTLLGPVADAVYPNGETMGIIAYASEMKGSWTGSLDGASLYIDGGEFKYDEFWGRWAGWDGSAHYPYYWPDKGSLVFAGYSPYRRGGSPLENVSFDVKSKTLSVTDYQVEPYVPMTEAQMYDGSAQYTNKNQSDLMYFLPRSDVYGNYIGVNALDAYPAAFYHALALVVFNVQAESSDDVNYIRLKGITLDGMASAGDLSVQMSNTPAGNVEWTLSDGASFESRRVLYNPSKSGGMKLSTAARQVVEILTIPVGLHNIEITYSLIVNEDPHEETMTYQTQWEAGKKYVYNLILGTENIQLIPQITTDWATNE